MSKPSTHSNCKNLLNPVGIFGNLISKCIRLSEHIRHIRVIEVLYRLRNNKNYFDISRETPCIDTPWCITTTEHTYIDHIPHKLLTITAPRTSLSLSTIAEIFNNKNPT